MKKYAIILVALFTMSSCYKKIIIDYEPYYHDPSDIDLREEAYIMSFNLRSPQSKDTGTKEWSFRRPGAVAMIKTLRPETIGVQEPDKVDGLLKDLSEDLANDYALVYGEYGGDVSSTNRGEYCAVFYLKDSLELVGSKTYWLKPGSINTKSRQDDCTKFRIATCVTFKRKSTGSKFVHINTHLENDAKTTSGLVREDEVRALAEIIDDYIGTSGLPWAMTADYNTGEDDPIFDILYNGYNMKSARAEAHRSDNKYTYNGFGSSSSNQWDHVFYSSGENRFDAREFATVTKKWAGVTYISDHYPVYAILKFNTIRK